MINLPEVPSMVLEGGPSPAEFLALTVSINAVLQGMGNSKYFLVNQ